MNQQGTKGNIKLFALQKTGVVEEERKKRVELHEDIMMDNFPYLKKNAHLEMQKLCEPQAGNISKVTISTYFTVKLLNSKDKEQEFKAIRKKVNTLHMGTVTGLSPIFSSENN